MEISYVITIGDYSDYRIIGVFDDKEKAEKAKNSYNKVAEEEDLGYGSRAVIEEYFKNILGNVPDGHKRIRVHMDVNGYSKLIQEVDGEDSSYSSVTPPYRFGHTIVDGIRVREGVCFEVIATDFTHAIKIANEKRAQLIANNEWNKLITD